MKTIAAAAVAIVIGFIAGDLWGSRSASPVKLDTPYQAVLLDTGQVYYGHLEGLGSSFPTMRDVFYIQSQQNAQTKEVTNILIRRGKEWHGPDKTVLNARHIVMIEPVSPSSKVAQLISEAKQ
jgi:hypothetical protein